MKRKNSRPKKTVRPQIGKRKLEEMIEEATVDCYDEGEQLSGWLTVIQDYLETPFETMILGVPVTVETVDLDRSDQIVAVCRRGSERQTVPILDLPLPKPFPEGAEWIEAYRHWIGGWE